MEYKPIDNKVVLKQLKKQKKASGIIVPDLGQNKTIEVEVLSIGPGLPMFNNTSELLTSNKVQKRYPMQIKVGDIVVIPKYGLHEYDENGKKYFIGKESDILFIKTEV